MILRLITVDDSATIRRIVKSYSEELADQVEVVEAENGQECLDQTLQQRPDVIVLDINMPVMDGEECLRQLKADPETAEIPVVILTTESEKSVVLRLLQMGISQYIIKPFSREEFVDKVGSVLIKRAAAEASEAQSEEPTIPDGEYVLAVMTNSGETDQIRDSGPDSREVLMARDTSEALSFFKTKAPLAVIADLEISEHEILDMFAQMRRVPDRQNVCYLAACPSSAEDLVSHVRAIRYISLLPKPFSAEDLRVLLPGEARAKIHTAATGDVYVIQAGAIPFSDQEGLLREAIQSAVWEGHLKLLVDLSRIPIEDQGQKAIWLTLMRLATGPGVRTVYVTQCEDIREQLQSSSETKEIQLVAAVAEGLMALAA